MDAPPDGFEKFARLWQESGKSLEDLLSALGRAANELSQRASQPGAVPELLQQLGKAGRDLLEWQQRVLSDLSAQTQQRAADLDGAGMEALRHLARARWEEELRRLADLPAQLIARAAQADPARLQRLIESMVQEIAADFQSLKDDAFRIQPAELIGAWTRTLAGDEDEKARKIWARFQEAMRVKAKFGWEYYADPERTPLGQTPRERVHQQGRIELFRYRHPDGRAPGGKPVLLCYSVINRSTILDLMPGYSFIEHLLSQGLDVYLMEWGKAEPFDRDSTLDSLIDPGMHGCLQAVRRLTGARRVPIFGHCIGGNFALLYAALFPEEVERLVILTTPITAARGGVVALWTDPQVFPVDEIVDRYGLMPAKLIRYTFIALKPYYEVMKWKMFLENLGNDAVMNLFYPVDRWANENVDVSAEVFRKFVREVLQDERFAKGETRIHGRPAALSAITCPVYTLAASRDWIVPPDSAMVLNDLVQSRDKRATLIEGAHVGIMIDPRARTIWQQMSDFLREAAPPPRAPRPARRSRRAPSRRATASTGRRKKPAPRTRRRS